MILMKYIFFLMCFIQIKSEIVKYVSADSDQFGLESVSKKLKENNIILELDYYNVINSPPYSLPINSHIKKIFIDDPRLVSFVYKIPKEKLVLLEWEPWVKFPKSYYDLYSRVYTWKDDLIDGIKFFKLYCPYLQPMIEKVPNFKEKKFAVIIVTNWTSNRKKLVKSFNFKHYKHIDIYGRHTPSSEIKKNYKGEIPGFHTSNEKLKILSKYKFCICFENCSKNGYLTEKILGCFSAGCIPIYWGTPNIEKYIPKECFIDYRDFKNNKKLYKFLENMTQETYDKYIQNIKNFIQSEKAKVFTLEYFAEMICKEINL